jgi:capsule polysaccharide export protein KpsE/RkpR
MVAYVEVQRMSLRMKLLARMTANIVAAKTDLERFRWTPPTQMDVAFATHVAALRAEHAAVKEAFEQQLRAIDGQAGGADPTIAEGDSRRRTATAGLRRYPASLRGLGVPSWRIKMKKLNLRPER